MRWGWSVGLGGHDRDDDPAAVERQATRRNVPIAAVVAGAAQDDDGSLAPPLGVDGERANGRGDRRARLLHQAILADAEPLRPPVRAAHRLGADGRQGGTIRPALPKPAQVELEQLGVVGGEARAGGRARHRTG